MVLFLFFFPSVNSYEWGKCSLVPSPPPQLLLYCVLYIGTASDNRCGRGLGMRLARVSVSAVGMHSPMVM